MGIFLWTLSFGSAGFSFRSFCGEKGFPLRFGEFRKKQLELAHVRNLLDEIHAQVEAGKVPEERLWVDARLLPAPWGMLVGEGLQKLRSVGAPILPTLRRLKGLAENEEEALARARAKSAQASAQAFSGIALVPLFACALYVFLPETQEHLLAFLLLCGAALIWAILGGVWILRMTDQARWAGLSEEWRPWVAASACAGERFLSLLRSGSPPDLAWEGVRDFLSEEAPGLALRWGTSLWAQGEGDQGLAPESVAARLATAGESLRASVQASILEGTPCAERAESVIAGWRKEWNLSVERALTLLPQKALIPLFVCVAPPLLLLLGGGLWFAASSAMELSGS